MLAKNVEMQSLGEVAGTVNVSPNSSFIKRLFTFGGPAFLVSVGYMDPGNWGTDMAGGSQYGYKLLWVILLSNLMAQVLQVLCARLGLVTGLDLASACRTQYKKPAAIALWFLAEIAIIATDLAEVIGSAVALKLLIGLDLVWGVLLTGADVLILLALMKFGFRLIEAIVITLVGTIGVCFAFQMFIAKPDIAAATAGMLIPSMPDTNALLISLGILGATVMPHNLYLHSAVVQTRKFADLKQAIKFNTADTIVALSLAFFVNASILILAAAVFKFPVNELEQGHKLLQGALGGAAATAFAVALLCSGQSSTITGTLAGQVVMEGFLQIKVKPWIRRLVTRLLAIVPALFVIIYTGGAHTVQMLVVSQIVLSAQLSFAIFPLIMLTSNRKLMGEFVSPTWLTTVGYTICMLVASLNVYALAATLNDKVFGYPTNPFAPPGWMAVGLLGAIVAGFAAWVKFGYEEKSGRSPSTQEPSQ
ncbi:MAG: Nramp family divalent metal transporter [Fimbriimonadaceae bacterium]